MRDLAPGNSVYRSLALVVAILLATPLSAPRADDATATLQVQPAAAAQLAVTFLANEAFHVSDGEHAVILDAFVMQTYLQYGALQPATWRALCAGEPPFDAIDLALVSHVHRDHHQPAASHEFLEKRPRVPLVTSRDGNGRSITRVASPLWSFSIAGDGADDLYAELADVLRSGERVVLHYRQARVRGLTDTDYYVERVERITGEADGR